MKRIKLLETGEMYNMGDIITLKHVEETEDEVLTCIHKIRLTENNVKDLEKAGIIEVLTVKDKINRNIEYWLDRAGVIQERTARAVVFSAMLKDIAIEMDKNYPDYIANSPEIYVVSMLNGEIVRINKSLVKNYNNFAAFRTYADAKLACCILKPFLDQMFSED